MIMSFIARVKIIMALFPTLAPERALKALREQLDALQKLKNRNYQEAEKEETEWRYLTESIIENAFGNLSSELSKFNSVCAGAPINMRRRISPQQFQADFERRIQKFEALLHSLIKPLELQLPEEEVQGVYESGDEYAFYRDLSSLVESATKDILIVDAYLDEEVFNLYVDKVPDGVTVRILSTKIGPNVETVAKKCAKTRPLELRSSRRIHDRMVFTDQRGWVIGQSIKDAAQKKPTYLIELNEPSLTAIRSAHDEIWKEANIIAQPLHG